MALRSVLRVAGQRLLGLECHVLRRISLRAETFPHSRQKYRLLEMYVSFGYDSGQVRLRLGNYKTFMSLPPLPLPIRFRFHFTVQY